jgi:hypothetical protein
VIVTVKLALPFPVPGIRGIEKEAGENCTWHLPAGQSRPAVP